MDYIDDLKSKKSIKVDCSESVLLEIPSDDEDNDEILDEDRYH